MILIFLGSWRSTLIIMISIPLAILTSVALLAATGETINVMTLGGLALAVGILVDDATVTIENINYHLEQGKDIETAIMDGARQIVIPATVSLLCICIVFVPMFTLGGVAGYPVSSDGEGGRFRADRLLCALAHAGQHDGALPARPPGDARPRGAPPADAQSARSFPARIRTALRGRAGLLSAPAHHRAWPDGWLFVAGFLVAVLCSFALAPYLGRNFFPPVESTQIALHVRAPTGTRIEETGVQVDKVEAAIRAIIPPTSLRSIVDNIGLSISGINMAYANTGSIGASDADILITLNDGREAEAPGYVKAMRERCRASFRARPSPSCPPTS